MQRFALCLALVLAVPLSAQQQQSADPPVRVKSTGLPSGWTLRLDDKEKRSSADDARFEIMGAGFHVTSGPAALYYSELHRPTGSYTARASLTQMKMGPHPEAYGLFVGGTDLATPQQQYLYFLVRGDGKYYIAHRAGSDVHIIVPWTSHEAVKKADDSGKQTNELAIRVAADSVHLLVNAQRVRSLGKTEMRGYHTDGQMGLRVNHNLDVHVGGLEIRQD